MLEVFGIIAALAATPSAAPGAEPCTHGPVPKSIVSIVERKGASPVRPYAVVTFSVAPDGTVVSSSLLETSGNPGDDTDALEASKHWEFLPAKNGCKPVSGTATFTLPMDEGSAAAIAPLTIADPCNHESLLVSGVAPYYPYEAKDKNHYTSFISVGVDGVGRLVDIGLQTSSGNPNVDRAAWHAASRSAYTGKVSACQASDGTYTFKANFDPK